MGSVDFTAVPAYLCRDQNDGTDNGYCQQCRNRTRRDSFCAGFGLACEARCTPWLPCCSCFGSDLAEAATLKQGVAAFNRQDYMVAAQILTPYAERGHAVRADLSWLHV